MGDIPKIDVKELKRTNLGFPSEWKLNNIRIHYRHGYLTLFVDEVERLKSGKFWDEFDLGGYLSDEELARILAHHDLLVDKK